MSRALATVIACSLLLGSTFAKAAVQPDKAAVKQATATCRAEVKEDAKYNEMSLGRGTRRSKSASQRLWLSTKAARSRPASKRVKSSKADADDPTLIERAELASAGAYQ
jgi:hypothetical protein